MEPSALSLEKLKEAYAAINPNVEVQVQQSDSTTGMTSAIEGGNSS